MKIKRMRATFGRLDRAEVAFSDGLNIIHAPNEAGKSTWCGFLRAMFYGIDTNQRDKRGFVAEKNRYAPWSGAPMEGELELEWQGRDIILRRFAKGGNPFGGFSAVYSDTQQPVPGLTGDNCGLTLLGVEREVWERSAFVGQAPTLTIDGTPELERRIAALVSSGQEDVSYTDTRDTLSKWLRRRRHNKSGLIPQLETELAELDVTLSRLASAHERYARGQAEIARLEQEQTELQQERHIHKRNIQAELNRRFGEANRRREQLEKWLLQLCAVAPDEAELSEMRQQLGRLDALKEELQRAQTRCAEAEKEVQQAEADCPESPLFHLTRLQMDEICQVVRQMQRKGKRLSCLRFVSLLLGAGLGVATSVLTKPVLAGTLGCWLGVGVAVLAGLVAFVVLTVLAGAYRRRAQGVLSRYHVSTTPELTALWEKEQEARTRLEQAEGRLTRCRQEQEQIAARCRAVEVELNELTTDFADATQAADSLEQAVEAAAQMKREADGLRGELAQTHQLCADLAAQGAQEVNTLEMLHAPERTREETERDLTRVEQELSVARTACAMAQGELQSSGDRAGLEARRAQLQTQLSRRQMEYDAIEQAIAALDRANETLRQRFAPQLNRLASHLLAQLTGGRYEKLELTRDFAAGARSEGDLLPRSALNLSRGTAEQIYLAVRLAICQLCLPGEDASPVVLDDALLTFDDARMAAALEVLAGLGRQVLLFSCQRREAEVGIGSIQTLQSE